MDVEFVPPKYVGSVQVKNLPSKTKKYLQEIIPKKETSTIIHINQKHQQRLKALKRRRDEKIRQGKAKPVDELSKKMYYRAKARKNANKEESLEPIFLLGEDDFWINTQYSDLQLEFLQELAEKVFYNRPEVSY